MHSHHTENRSNEDTGVLQSVPDTEGQGCEADQDRCLYCLCCPCVTSAPQSWLGNGHPPRPGNNLICKKIYRKFWSMLDHRGLWNNPLYLQKKHNLMQDAHIELTVREIMPECVLNLV